MPEKNQGQSLHENYRKKQINLLPDLYFKKKRRLRVVTLVLLVVAVAISGFVAQIMSLYQELEYVKHENQIKLQLIAEKEEERQRQTLLTALKERIEFKVNLVKQIEEENASLIAVTNAIESTLPEGVFYISVNFESEEQMTVFGRAEKESEIPDLIHKIRTLNYFDDIKINSISRQVIENYDGVEDYFNFVLMCDFGGVTDEAN